MAQNSKKRFMLCVENRDCKDLERRKIYQVLPDDEALALAVKKINNRPRKCLDYQTPHEVYYQARRGAVAT
jgi:IS30 family transposase